MSDACCTCVSVHVCECLSVNVSSLSQWLMGTRHIHAEKLPGALFQAFYMETVRNCYVSRLRHSFSAFPLAPIQTALTHTYFYRTCLLLLPLFLLSVLLLFAHFHLKHTLVTLVHCSKVASAQHSTLFHASPRMTDSKQHFLPFFFHGKLLSLYNLVVWQPARPTITLSFALFLSCLSSLSITHASGQKS